MYRSNYYRRFIKGYSQRSAPLRELISKDKYFVSGPEQDSGFADLKSALKTAPILQYPDTSRAFFLETDTAVNGLSYVLGQEDNKGRRHVISFGGRGL